MRMQEMKNRSIVIASILKPVDDTRMFDKMGRSLAGDGWRVNIIGYGDNVPVAEESIKFYALGKFERLSVKRAFAKIKVLWWLMSINPRVVIINTHELLLASMIYKLLRGAKIIYDIREDYFLNIKSTNTLPLFIRDSIALMVRLNEWIFSPLIKHFILAEQSYQYELPFIGTRFSIVENKCQLPQSFIRNHDRNSLNFVFTGTLDTSTGIFQAIDLVKAMHKLDSSVKLKIIGYASLEKVREKILSSIDDSDFIEIVGLNTLVPHSIIFEEISKANAGIIYYPPSIHNEKCIPTKLYEYMACELPFIYDSNVYWDAIAKSNHAGIAINFLNPEPKTLLSRLKTHNFYPAKAVNAFWHTEEKTLLDVVNRFTKI